jgi:hypothetical protein
MITQTGRDQRRKVRRVCETHAPASSIPSSTWNRPWPAGESANVLIPVPLTFNDLLNRPFRPDMRWHRTTTTRSGLSAEVQLSYDRGRQVACEQEIKAAVAVRSRDIAKVNADLSAATEGGSLTWRAHGALETPPFLVTSPFTLSWDITAAKHHL